MDHRLFSRRTFVQAGLAAGALTAFPASFVRAAAPSFNTVNSGTLTVAALGEMPASGMENGKLVGTDGDMVNAIAQKLGLKTNLQVMDNAATIEAARSGRADIMIGNTRWTAQRSEVMLLTDAAYYVTYGAITRKDSKLSDSISIGDLKGQRLGTLTGASSSADLKKVPGAADVRFYDTSDATTRDIMANRLDFAILDPTLIAYMTAKNPSLNLKHVTFKPDPEFAVLTARTATIFGMNPQNPDLFDAVNAGVKWLWRTKGNEKIFAKYGLTDPQYFQPLATNPRIGVDRDAEGNILGKFAHKPKNYDNLFA